MMARRSFLVSLLFIVCCSHHAPPMKNDSIGTVKKLRVGMVQLSQNDLDESLLYNCIRNYPSAVLASSGSTEQELLEAGYSKERLTQSLMEQRFDIYGDVKNFSLLLLFFRNNEKQNYIRLVNFLSRQIRTVSIEPSQLSCENIFSTVRLVAIDSLPAFADVYVNDRLIGEAPLWTSLNDGTYDVQCKLPDDSFPTSQLKVPGTVQFLCKRNNQQSMGAGEEEETPTYSEKTQSWLVYGIFGILSVSSAALPFLLF